MGTKEELLAAIAAAGTQGKVDYEAAQVANRNAQAAAIQAALAGVAANSNPGAQQQLSQIVSQPYQVSNEHLAANEAAQQTWMNESKWNTGVFQGNIERLRDALIAQTLAEQAASGGGGGGGGSGGGGGGSDTIDWYSNLKDAFGTADIGKQAIAAEADQLGLTKYKNSGLSPHEATQQYAVDKYGVPPGVAAAWYKQSKDDVAIQNAATNLARKAGRGKLPMRQLKSKLRANNRANPGDQTYIRKQAVEMARQQRQAQQQRRRKRRR